MKKYNVGNYARLKEDIKRSIQLIPIIPDHNLNRDDLTVKYMPLVENLAKKFSTTEQASGVLDITDLMQYGYLGLIKAIDKINVLILIDSKDPEKTIKSFISKRVKGAIRRAINQNRGDMKIPEYKLNEMRGLDLEEDEYDPRVALFFNQVFQSTDAIHPGSESNFGQHTPYDIPDESEPYNIDLLNKYLLGIMKQHLSQSQYDVLRLSYGLDVPKMSAIDIASTLDMNMATASVRISQIKREAIETLTRNVSPEQIFEL
jgi:RNA polymerase sigma factor (sigma-70 family)